MASVETDTDLHQGPGGAEAEGPPTMESVQSNPHLWQVLQPGGSYTSRTDVPFSRLLLPDAPRLAYRRRTGERKTVIHWGQRKLLLAELEFLTMYAEPGLTVVYAGAAPGTHIGLLVELFPALSFVLVDPAPFSPRLSEGARCLLRQELFTDEVAYEFRGRGDVLFLCDVRSCDWLITDEAEVEGKVMVDMLAQQRWHDIIRPKKSLLKFRLPWTVGGTEYLAGDVRIQPFGPITTTETRLVPHGHERVEWDNKQYWEQMFHFNTVTRVARYPHVVPVGWDGGGLDYCYDCRSEVEILEAYVRKYDAEARDPLQRVLALTHRASRECAPHRTLLDPNSDPEVRTRAIRSMQWVAGKPAYDEDNVAPKETAPVYSSEAEQMMAKMGYKKGTGLGANEQGITAPIDESGQFRRRGVGFGVPGAPPPTQEPGSGDKRAAEESVVGGVRARARARQK